jgi:hypothetical protein
VNPAAQRQTPGTAAFDTTQVPSSSNSMSEWSQARQSANRTSVQASRVSTIARHGTVLRRYASQAHRQGSQKNDNHHAGARSYAAECAAQGCVLVFNRERSCQWTDRAQRRRFGQCQRSRGRSKLKHSREKAAQGSCSGNAGSCHRAVTL